MFLRILFCLTFACAFVATAPCARSAASDLTSVNLDKIERFRSAIDASNAPVTVVAFGDSVSETWISPQKQLFEMLASRSGFSGFAIQNAWNMLMGQMGNGTQGSVGTTNWWSYHYLLPPDGFLFWTNYSSATGSIMSDQLKVFWVAGPKGGTFNLSISTNGGPWSSSLAVLDGYGPQLESRHATFKLPRNPYQIRVDGVTGTNVILGPQYLDTLGTGINAAFLSIGGVNLDNILSRSTNVLVPVIKGLDPRLIVWHMKELADIGEVALSNRLDHLEAYWGMAAPAADVVYIGTPWESRDTNWNYTATQNAIVRNAAIKHGRAYVDCMNPCNSYHWMLENGFMYDAVHPSHKCNQFMAEILWRELGLFALRRDRSLRIMAVSDVIQLEWNASADLAYAVQSSADQLLWTTEAVLDGINAGLSVTNSLQGKRFFRLSLAPR